MKKIAIVLGVVLVSNMNHAFYGNQLIQREYDQDPSQISFLDATNNLKDEYEFYQSNQSNQGDEYQSNQSNQGDEYQGNEEDNQVDIDEYDQHVCDEVSPAKISAAEALIKEMFGFVLIQYMAIRAITQAYCTEIKQALNKWFTTFIKA